VTKSTFVLRRERMLHFTKAA